MPSFSPCLLRLLQQFLPVVFLLGCSDRPSIAARATVQTFYGAILTHNLPLVEDNLAQSASPVLRDHVLAVAASAQTGGAAERAVRVVRIERPSVRGSVAWVRVVFADGSADQVSLVREGQRWKVTRSERLG